MMPSRCHDQLLESPGDVLMGPAAAVAGGTSGPDGRFGLGDPIRTLVNRALGL